MKRLLVAAGAVLLLLLVAAAAFFFMPAPLPRARASADQPIGAALIAKGRYLATAADCVVCHTAPGGTPYAGGRAFVLPFGTLYSPNITPDRATGIGGWSDAEFVRALRHGVGRHGEDLYPAFPYASYARMTDDDALAIRAYLATLPAVRAAAPANALTFPFNQRWLMRGWKLLFLPHGSLRPDPARPPAWNRGAYLVEALGHCGECHTPRNTLYGLKRTARFAGATTQGWTAWNITSDPKAGIGGWPVDALAAYLGTGHADGHGAASGPMAEVVEASTSHLTPADQRAIALYLKALPAKAARHGESAEATPPPLAASSTYAPGTGEKPTLGRHIFEGACASCHGWNGAGLQGPAAALLGAQSVTDPKATNVVQVILHGQSLAVPGGHIFMPAFGQAYSDPEIAAVANYVIAHFGGRSPSVSPSDVAAARKISGGE